MGVRMSVMQTTGKEATVSLKVLRLGRVIWSKDLPRSGLTVILAAKFRDQEVHAGIPSVILVFVDGVEQPYSLDSDTFLRYAKLIFHIHDNGSLTIWGVRAKSFDICRLWGFGFLGREYKGREKERIKSQAKFTELREFNGGNSEACTVNDEGIFTQVMGPKHPGRVRGYGLGPTPSQVFGGPSNGQSQSSSQDTTSPLVEQLLQSLESVIGTQNEVIKQMARKLQACGILDDLDALFSGPVPQKQAEVQPQMQMQAQQQPQAQVQPQTQMQAHQK